MNDININKRRLFKTGDIVSWNNNKLSGVIHSDEPEYMITVLTKEGRCYRYEEKPINKLTLIKSIDETIAEKPYIVIEKLSEFHILDRRNNMSIIHFNIIEECLEKTRELAVYTCEALNHYLKNQNK